MVGRCGEDTARALACRDGQAAAHLKLISIWVIFFTSVVGISSPVLLARYFQGKPLYDKAVLVIKCFAAGVIMSTSLVHVLPDAFDALADCQVASHHPWKDFPFSGLVTMVGALVALFVDITASSHVAHSQGPPDHYAAVPALTQEELMETKKPGPGESRCEAGELVPSHEQRVDELVRLKQRLVSQVVEKGILFFVNLLHKIII